MARNVRGRRLSFARHIEGTYTESDIYFIAVGTPPGDGGRADLRAVFAAAETIAKTAARPAVLADTWSVAGVDPVSGDTVSHGALVEEDHATSPVPVAVNGTL